MLGLDVSQENGIQTADTTGPNSLERPEARPGVKEHRAVAAALAHQVRIRHPDAVLHPERPYAKRQRPDLRQRIATGAEGAEPHFVEPQDGG